MTRSHYRARDKLVNSEPGAGSSELIPHSPFPVPCSPVLPAQLGLDLRFVQPNIATHILAKSKTTLVTIV